MIIFLSISALLIFSLHKWVMHSVDSYDKYGGTHTTQEWREFEKSHSVIR